MPFVHVPEEQMQAILDLAGKDAPTLADLKAAVPFKPWYTQDGYARASISFDDRAPGVVVKLKDANGAGHREITNLLVVNNGTITLRLEAIAALCRAHIAGIEDPQAKKADVFALDFPAPSDPLAKWVAWAENIAEKNLRRLRDGIWHFRNVEVEQGND